MHLLGQYYGQAEKLEAVTRLIDHSTGTLSAHFFDVVHALNLLVKLDDAALSQAAEACQGQQGASKPFCSVLLPESQRSKVFARLRAQRLNLRPQQSNEEKKE